jgi:hypothetical protein
MGKNAVESFELTLRVRFDPDLTNFGHLVGQLQSVLQSDYVTDRVDAAYIELLDADEIAGSLNEQGEYELPDGGCLQLDREDQSIRRVDMHGNSDEIREPGDEGYDEWRDLFPKPQGFESADVSLFHLEPAQIQKLFDAAIDILTAGDGEETIKPEAAKIIVEPMDLDELLALFPGDVADYRQRGIDFDPNTGKAWEE